MRNEVLSEAHVEVCEVISREREKREWRGEHGERSGMGGGEFIGCNKPGKRGNYCSIS